MVDGSLAHSPFTIQSGATLAGGGTVGDLTVDGGGTVAPGLVTPITTLSVAGNVSFASGSTLAVTVLPDGRSDNLAATGTITRRRQQWLPSPPAPASSIRRPTPPS